MPANSPPPSLLMHDAGLERPSLERALRRLLKRPSEPLQVAAQAGSDDPYTFQPTSEGSGIFGEWTLDANGLPAYEYTLDQYADTRARFPNTANLDRRDHWHQIGNDRVTGLVSNDGTVQVYLGDRGGVFLNYFASRGDPVRPDLPARTGVALLAYNALKFVIGLATRVLMWWRHFQVGKPQTVTSVLSVNSQEVRPRGTTFAEPSSILAQALTRHPTSHFAYAGGFSYLERSGEVWATAFRYRKLGVQMRRVFGMGSMETEMIYRDIRVTRRVYAPHGDYPFLLVDVEYENVGDKTVDFRAYEYWDVNVQQMKLQWLRGEAFTEALDGERSALNDLFTPKIEWVAQANALRFHQTYIHSDLHPDPEAVSDIDIAPADIFLTDLTGKPDAYYVDKRAFFGKGDVRQPQAVSKHLPTMSNAPSNDSMPYCMVMRRDFVLAPGVKASQRYAYGTVLPDASLEYHTPFPKDDLLAKTAADWKTRLPYFHTGVDATLKREMAWHAYYLLSATLYNDYFKTHVIPQGSAYLYVHGVDGVPRDQALSTLPLVYLQPELARDNLRMIMSLMDGKSGAIAYGFSGHGFVDNAVIHDLPSDLDLFLLLALNEYLSATGDMTFLDCKIPFYAVGLPPGARGKTVLDHVRCAVYHLIHVVRLGDHGLIRMGDGDWSDGVVFETCLKFGGANALQWFVNSKNEGESIPNTQMALYVLPITQALLQTRDHELALEIEQFLAKLENGVHAQWNGRWYLRALLRDEANRPVAVDNDQINLEAQPWALISRKAVEYGTDEALVKSITTLLDFPSKTGAPSQENGLVWPAISQLLTWGYCRTEPRWAWRSLLRQTLAVHAEIFPESWIGVWSAPDALFTKTSPENPGGAWQSTATPMIDFPVMNSNPHAMALLGLLRVCGIEPSEDGAGLIIDPHVPRDHFSLDTPLLRLEIAPGSIVGDYRAIITGQRTLYITVPATATQITARAGKRTFNVAPTTRVALLLELVAKRETHFEVHWQ